MDLKPSIFLRFLAGLALAAAIAALLLLRILPNLPHPPAAAPPGVVASHAPFPSCDPPGWEAATRANRASLSSLTWAPFGRPETGWDLYAPALAEALSPGCAAISPGFAAGYAKWQAAAGLPVNGVFTPAEFPRLLAQLELRRPFVQVTRSGACPAPPPPYALRAAGPDEGFWGKVVSLRPGALAAFRRMAAQARADGAASSPLDFKLISGFRGPAEEAAGCVGGRCDRTSRASCSAHRTGLAVDIYLGAAAGSDPVSTDPANRRAIVRSRAYRWMVRNAGHYGFLNYPYEPWHWEWTGETP